MSTSALSSLAAAALEPDASARPPLARFACPFVPCDKVFADESNYEVHLQTHSAEHSFACEICGESFPFRSSLVNHLRSHPEIRAYACTECDLSFVHKRSLVTHMRVHSDDHGYECELCHKRFVHRSSLITHARIHSGDRPYECPECGLGFSQQGNLNKHIRTHTGERPFQCEYCDRSFVQKNHLIRHRTLHTDAHVVDTVSPASPEPPASQIAGHGLSATHSLVSGSTAIVHTIFNQSASARRRSDESDTQSVQSNASCSTIAKSHIESGQMSAGQAFTPLSSDPTSATMVASSSTTHHAAAETSSMSCSHNATNVVDIASSAMPAISASTDQLPNAPKRRFVPSHLGRPPKRAFVQPTGMPQIQPPNYQYAHQHHQQLAQQQQLAQYHQHLQYQQFQLQLQQQHIMQLQIEKQQLHNLHLQQQLESSLAVGAGSTSMPFHSMMSPQPLMPPPPPLPLPVSHFPLPNSSESDSTQHQLMNIIQFQSIYHQRRQQLAQSMNMNAAPAEISHNLAAVCVANDSPHPIESEPVNDSTAKDQPQ